MSAEGRAVHLDFDEAVSLLEGLVEARGENYIDPQTAEGSCRYFLPTGKPSCIIGHVLDKKGITYDQAYNDGWNTSTNVQTLMDHEQVIDVDSPRTQELLQSVQMYQDRGFSWGQALKRAKHDVRFRHG